MVMVEMTSVPIVLLVKQFFLPVAYLIREFLVKQLLLAM
jgi:hypothetical protein